MLARPALAAALVLAATPAIPAAAGPAAPAGELTVPDISFTRTVLPNGLTLVVHEDHKAPVVAVNIWYHVGSKDEQPGRTGFAHLFEHLMFQPSEHARADFIKTLEGLGATGFNGTTDQDRTNFFEVVPVSALDTVLWMEADRMGHLVGAIDQKKLDLQRGVVQNEKRQDENEPYGRVEDVMTPALYPAAHPYAHTVIGSMRDLDAASLDDVKRWFATYYGPSNATVVVSGDVTAADALARVERAFGAIPPGPPLERQTVWVAPRTGEQRMRMQDRVPQARVYLTWNTAAWGSRDDTLLSLAAQVLSAGRSSRLFKRLVYDDQIATDVSASQGTNELGSTFTVEATARPGGDLAAVERAIREELARFLAGGPTADELARARTETFAGFIRGVERIGGFGGTSDVLAEGQVFGGDPGHYREELGWVRAATTGDVRAAARRWLSDGVAVLSVEPFPELREAAGAAPTTPPPAGTPPDARFPALQRATLSNGLTVILAERHAVPVVNLDLYLDAGYASDLGGLAGTARLAGAMLDEGTTRRTALQISDEAQRLGAALSAGSNLDQTVVALSALTANLDPSLDLFADVVLHPSFPAADLERLRKQQLAAIEQEMAEPFGIAERIVPGLLYGPDHAYGQPLTGSGTAASVRRITRADCVRWHDTWFRPNAATLVVVGDTTLADLVPRLERLLGGWRRGEVPAKRIGPVAPPAGALYLVDRPGSEQSLLLMGLVAPPRNAPGAIPQEVMNAILGGKFGSRLNLDLREDKHWTYGAGTVIVPARGPQPYIGYAPVQADRTSEALAEFLKILRGIRGAQPIRPDELRAAEASLTLSLPGRWETGGAVAHSIAEIVRFGLDDHYWDGYASKVRAVDLAAASAAAGIIDPDRVVWVVVGDRARIEPGLRALGLGEIRHLGADGAPLAAPPQAGPPAAAPAAPKAAAPPPAAR